MDVAEVASITSCLPPSALDGLSVRSLAALRLLGVRQACSWSDGADVSLSQILELSLTLAVLP